MEDSSVESEAKLLIVGDNPQAVVKTIEKLTNIGVVRVGEEESIQIEDTYFDTIGLDLWRLRLSLRIRVENDQWKLTLKGPKTSRDDAFFERSEFETTFSDENLSTMLRELRSRGAPLELPKMKSKEGVQLLHHVGLQEAVKLYNNRCRKELINNEKVFAYLFIDKVTYEIPAIQRGIAETEYGIEIEAVRDGEKGMISIVVDWFLSTFSKDILPAKHSKYERGIQLVKSFKESHNLG